jgi:penicillin-binding protein 1A
MDGAEEPAPDDPEGASDEPTDPSSWRVQLRRHWRWARWPIYGFGSLFLIGLAGFVFLWFTVKLPKDLPPVQSSIVVDAKGRQLAVFQQNGLREPVRLDQVAPVVVDALLSAEDRHFYDHHGVDPSGFVRALWHDVKGDSVQGGSTITQQLVKNSYLNGDRSLARKAKEAVLALKLEQTLDKNDILDRYLNIVYFGRGAYGIQAAARVYFDTTASELNANQAAFLIGLLPGPETAEPSTAPDQARQRRDHVVDAMVDNHKLSAGDAAAIKQQAIGAVPSSHGQVTNGVAPWFVELVREEAISRFGESAVYGGGLRITTTLDLDDENAAEYAVAHVLNQPDDPQAALVALDKSGAIRAYVGGRDYNTLKVDLARGQQGGGSGRQAGSTFKPFVLAADVEQGNTVKQVFRAPAHITLPTASGPWKVSNFGNESFGSTDLIDGTVHSINTVYAQLVMQVGPDKAVALAHAAGITSDLPAEPSITLGSGDVSPLEMADAYLTFARDGQRVEPFAIAKVEGPDGHTLFEANPKTSTATKPDTAHLVDFVLQQVIARGTGTAAKLDRPAAGKTGTTENNGDAWFAGYTPDYAAVVWMGYPEGNSHPMDDVHGIAVTGGTFPAQIWQEFMSAALTDVPPDKFADPPPALLGPQTRNPVAVAPSRTGGSPSASSETAATTPSTTAAPPPGQEPTTTTPAQPTSTTAPPPTSTATTSPPTTAAAGAPP